MYWSCSLGSQVRLAYTSVVLQDGGGPQGEEGCVHPQLASLWLDQWAALGLQPGSKTPPCPVQKEVQEGQQPGSQYRPAPSS